MNRLWSYRDYVEHLRHPHSLVRRWAFKAIETQFPRVFTKEVSNLIGDSDEYLACMAPKYLAAHGAAEFAPDIVESFKQGKNNVPSNCAIALGNLRYAQALDDILERFSKVESEDILLGILYYLGKIRQDDTRQILLEMLNDRADDHIVDTVAYHLLEHGNSEDIPKVLEIYLGRLEPEYGNDIFLKRLMDSLGAENLYQELTDYCDLNILESPQEVLEEKIGGRPEFQFCGELVDEIAGIIQKGDYQSLCTTLMFEAQNVVRKRFLTGSLG